MRLHNRQVKVGFWTDPDLLQLPRDMRMFYQGLWHCAEDSGCLEDSPFTLKLLLFPSPVDVDITVEMIADWIEQFIKMGKLIRYEVKGKKYLYLKNFHKHQTLRKPGASDIPLPPWIRWEETTDENGRRTSSRYIVLDPDDPTQWEDSKNEVQDENESGTESVPTQYQPSTETVQTQYQPSTNPVPTQHQPDTDSVQALKEKKGREENKEKGKEEKRREGSREPTNPPTNPPPESRIRYPPDATEQERLILHELSRVKGYPLDVPRDLEHIRTIAVDFPTIDLLAEAKRWRAYKLDKPLKKNSNARLQFRNWCEIAARRQEERRNGNGRSGAVEESPRKRGKYDDLVIG